MANRFLGLATSSNYDTCICSTDASPISIGMWNGLSDSQFSLYGDTSKSGHFGITGRNISTISGVTNDEDTFGSIIFYNTTKMFRQESPVIIFNPATATTVHDTGNTQFLIASDSPGWDDAAEAESGIECTGAEVSSNGLSVVFTFYELGGLGAAEIYWNTENGYSGAEDLSAISIFADGVEKTVTSITLGSPANNKITVSISSAIKAGQAVRCVLFEDIAFGTGFGFVYDASGPFDLIPGTCAATNNSTVTSGTLTIELKDHFVSEESPETIDIGLHTPDVSRLSGNYIDQLSVSIIVDGNNKIIGQSGDTAMYFYSQPTLYDDVTASIILSRSNLEASGSSLSPLIGIDGEGINSYYSVETGASALRDGGSAIIELHRYEDAVEGSEVLGTSVTAVQLLNKTLTIKRVGSVISVLIDGDVKITADDNTGSGARPLSGNGYGLKSIASGYSDFYGDDFIVTSSNGESVVSSIYNGIFFVT